MNVAFCGFVIDYCGCFGLCLLFGFIAGVFVVEFAFGLVDDCACIKCLFVFDCVWVCVCLGLLLYCNSVVSFAFGSLLLFDFVLAGN